MLTALPAPNAATQQFALAELIGAIGDGSFASRALQALNEPLRAASWSVYSLPAECAGHDPAPVLHLSASLGVRDVTQSAFAAYRAGLYRRDHSFDGVRRNARPGHAAVLRMRADEAPNPDHREFIYRRHQLAERLSVAAVQDNGALLAVNLYHHEHQGPFSAAEHDGFLALAPLLLAAVQRHVALHEGAAAFPDTGLDTRAALHAACAELTARELDVCERLLRGWTHEGVAADLGLSVATVKTYRARAFGRLGLHFRSELFARFGPRRP